MPVRLESQPNSAQQDDLRAEGAAMPFDLQHLLALGAGSLVGFSLALVGGGGSILAVPLLVHLVGVASPHVAIGTSAVAVSANAAVSLFGRAREGLVKWRCVAVFAAFGVVGALIGAHFGKAFDGEKLLALFAVLMLVVGALMLRGADDGGEPGVKLSRDNFGKLALFGVATGLLSGFFGIGGGFLIVPGLMAAAEMPIANAMASSLFAVAAFGVMTASTYAVSGLIDWWIAAAFVAGGAVGGLAGAWLSRRLARKRGMLKKLFAGVIFSAAAYMLFKAMA